MGSGWIKLQDKWKEQQPHTKFLILCVGFLCLFIVFTIPFITSSITHEARITWIGVLFLYWTWAWKMWWDMKTHKSTLTRDILSKFETRLETIIDNDEDINMVLKKLFTLDDGQPCRWKVDDDEKEIIINRQELMRILTTQVHYPRSIIKNKMKIFVVFINIIMRKMDRMDEETKHVAMDICKNQLASLIDSVSGNDQWLRKAFQTFISCMNTINSETLLQFMDNICIRSI
jgi:hypothetical protein